MDFTVSKTALRWAVIPYSALVVLWVRRAYLTCTGPADVTKKNAVAYKFMQWKNGCLAILLPLLQ